MLHKLAANAQHLPSSYSFTRRAAPALQLTTAKPITTHNPMHVQIFMHSYRTKPPAPLDLKSCYYHACNLAISQYPSFSLSSLSLSGIAYTGGEYALT
jgi:hypothetical protein